MNLKAKTRFRLTLELYVCGIAMLVGMSFLPFGLLLMAPAVLYLQPVSRELKTRREALAQKQKHILFGLQASFCGFVVVGLLVVALLRQTALAWIAFALISVLMLGSLFYGYEQVYKDEHTA